MSEGKNTLLYGTKAPCSPCEGVMSGLTTMMDTFLASPPADALLFTSLRSTAMVGIDVEGGVGRGLGRVVSISMKEWGGGGRWRPGGEEGGRSGLGSGECVCALFEHETCSMSVLAFPVLCSVSSSAGARVGARGKSASLSIASLRLRVASHQRFESNQ